MPDKPEVQRPANCDGMRWWSDEWQPNEKRLVDSPRTAKVLCVCIVVVGLIVLVAWVLCRGGVQ